jgi:hypothetical protein
MKRRFFVSQSLESKDAKIPKILDTKCVNKERKCLGKNSDDVENDCENKRLQGNYSNSDLNVSAVTPHLSPIRKCSSIYEIVHDESSLDSISSEEVVKTLTNGKKFVSTYSLIKKEDYNQSNSPEENLCVTNVECNSPLDDLEPFIIVSNSVNEVSKLEKNSSTHASEQNYYYFKNKTCIVI